MKSRRADAIGMAWWLCCRLNQVLARNEMSVWPPCLDLCLADEALLNRQALAVEHLERVPFVECALMWPCSRLTHDGMGL